MKAEGHGKQQRAIVLKLLEGLRGVSVSEQHRYFSKQQIESAAKKSKQLQEQRSAVAKQYLQASTGASTTAGKSSQYGAQAGGGEDEHDPDHYAAAASMFA